MRQELRSLILGAFAAVLAVGLSACNKIDPELLSLKSLEDVALTEPILGSATPSIGNSTVTIDFLVRYPEGANILLDPTHVQINAPTVNCVGPTIVTAGDRMRFIRFSGCSGDGTLEITLLPGSGESEDGEPFGGPTQTQAATIDNTAPVPNVTSVSSWTITANQMASFSVTYPDATYSMLTAGSFSLSGPACAIGVNGSHPAYTVSVGPCSGEGQLDLSLLGNVAQDAAGNWDVGAGTMAFDVDAAIPEFTISAPSATPIDDTGSADYTLDVTGADSSTLSSGQVTLFYTGTASCGTKNVSGSHPTYTVSLSDCTGNGTVAIQIPAGTVTDTLGNSNEATTAATAIAVQNPAVLTVTDSGGYDYGSRVTGVPYTHTFFLSNSSSANAMSLSFTGLAAPFSRMGGTCDSGSTLGVGATCTLVIGYEPQSLGSHSDTLVVGYYNGVSSTTLEVELYGTGTAPAMISISGSGVFGPTTAPGYMRTESFTLTNTGATAATSIIPMLDAPFYFAGGSYPGIGGDCTGTIGVGASCSVVVEYAPAATGTHNGLLDISYFNGAIATSETLPLMGQGVGPVSIFIGAPDTTIMNSMAVVEFPVSYTNANTINLTTGHLSLIGESSGCSTSVVDGITANPKVQITGCDGEGSLQFEISAGSAMGNGGDVAGTATSTSVIVDNTAPNWMGWVSPAGSVSGAASGFQFRWNAATDANGLSAEPYQITFYNDSSCASPYGSVGPFAPTSHNFDFVGMTGSKTALVRVVDAAGNEALSPCSNIVNVTAFGKGAFVSRKCVNSVGGTGRAAGSLNPDVSCANGSGNAFYIDGLDTGIASADFMCQSWARDAGLGNAHKYIAWGSESGKDAYCRVLGLSGTVAANCGQGTLPTNGGPWYTVKTGSVKMLEAGQMVASNIYDLTMNNLNFGIGRTELGGTISTGFVNTNTDIYGVFTNGGAGCFTTNGAPCTVGRINYTDFNWTEWNNVTAGNVNNHHLICIEK